MVGMEIKNEWRKLFWLQCGDDDLIGCEKDQVVVIKDSKMIKKKNW